MFTNNKTFSQINWERDDLDTILSSINERIHEEDKEDFLKNQSLKTQAKNNLGSQAFTAVIGKLLVGELKHQNPNLSSNEPENQNFFQRWLAADEQASGADSDSDDLDSLEDRTMNCWESILYAAIQAGAIDKSVIATKYAAAEPDDAGAKAFSDTMYAYLQNREETLARAAVTTTILQNQELSTALEKLTISKASNQYHRYRLTPEFKKQVIEAGKPSIEQLQPAPGQIVIYKRTVGELTGPTHIALSLGGGRIMTLNGEGAPVQNCEIGDWENIFLDDDWRDLTLDLLVNGWEVVCMNPPWA